MLTYRLLRSNKEMGPYSLQDLVSMGLKPYDLVWIDGRSAAWRYPSEIEELKPYSPAVEEQPYDRFYKKDQSAQEKENLVKEQVSPKETNSAVKDKQVFISMPKGEKPRIMVIGKKEQAAVVDMAQKSQPKTADTYVEKEIEKEPVNKTPVIPFSEDQEPQLEKKYEVSLDELKDQYIQTLVERKAKNSLKKKMGVFTKRAAIFIYGIILGTLIVLTVTREPGKANISERNNKPSTQQTGTNNGEQIPLTNDLKELLPAVTEEAHSPVVSEADRYKKERPAQNTDTETANPGNNPDKPGQADNNKEQPLSSLKDDNGSRNARVRDAGISSKDDILKKVTLSANDYKRAAFGGIKNLELTVSNNSKYILDNVIVELEYLKPSELPLKTETLEFKSIAPNGSMTIKVPDNNRGIKVNYRIRNVISSELNEEFAKNNK